LRSLPNILAPSAVMTYMNIRNRPIKTSICPNQRSLSFINKKPGHDAHFSYILTDVIFTNNKTTLSYHCISAGDSS